VLDYGSGHILCLVSTLSRSCMVSTIAPILDLSPPGQGAALQRVAECDQVSVVAFRAPLLRGLRTEVFTLTDVVENVRVDCGVLSAPDSGGELLAVLHLPLWI